ncbi:MAG: hypothetical protein KIT72_06035 [Polyangiaceae bacterium]|nr:hypothetical protein [Polyangiaceae bacterium]MCW5789960.1 hypothetical protein [Polyangiaceae bacterium]
MENGLVNLAVIVASLIIPMGIIPVILIMTSRGEAGEPPVEEQFAWRDEED